MDLTNVMHILLKIFLNVALRSFTYSAIMFATFTRFNKSKTYPSILTRHRLNCFQTILMSDEILHPAGIYLIKFKNGNTKLICEIYSKLTIKTVPLLLTLHKFHKLFWCFYC